MLCNHFARSQALLLFNMFLDTHQLSIIANKFFSFLCLVEEEGSSTREWPQSSPLYGSTPLPGIVLLLVEGSTVSEGGHSHHLHIRKSRDILPLSLEVLQTLFVHELRKKKCLKIKYFQKECTVCVQTVLFG